MAERKLRGIFDKETRRKAVAVVGAAMEIGVREGVVENTERCGSGDWNRRVYEESSDGERKFCYCLQTGTAYRLAFSWLARRWARTCRHTCESAWLAVESGRVGQFASEGQLLRSEVGADPHVGSATRAAPGS